MDYKWDLIIQNGSIVCSTELNISVWQRFWVWFFLSPAFRYVKHSKVLTEFADRR